MVLILFLLNYFSLIVFAVNNTSKPQAVGAKGILMCSGSPIVNAKIKLVDVDTYKNDLLGVTRTDENGFFEIRGATTEETEIEPILKIYHHCGNTKNSCARKATFHIPQDYIHDVTKKLYFDIGTINMEIGFKNTEEKDSYFLPLDINNKLRSNFEKKDSITDIERYFYPNVGNDMHPVGDNIFKRYDPEESYPITMKRFFTNNNNFGKRQIEGEDYDFVPIAKPSWAEGEDYDFVPIAKPSWASIGGVWGKRSYNKN
uniref:Transthyretin-like family-containing protein n=1 Tax=Strongyloides papillosus TaxID=174720 RepID=A0A0N5BND4_STREA